MATRELAADRVAITLVSASPEFAYRSDAVAEAFGRPPAVRHPVQAIARDFAADVIADSVESVSTTAKCVFLAGGGELFYDALVLTVGGRRLPAWPGVLTFRGERDVPALRTLAEQADRGELESIAFVVPTGVRWTLPLYELALGLASRPLGGHNPIRMILISPEPTPLAAFGHEVAAEARKLLDQAGVGFEHAVRPVVRSSNVVHVPGRMRDVSVDRVVALPVVEGPSIAGLPRDPHGFIPVDPHGFVRGVAHVYAAGDCIASTMKQGGLAAQQAGLVAEALARRAGVPLPVTHPQPVLGASIRSGAHLAPYLAAQEATEATAGTTPIDRLASILRQRAAPGDLKERVEGA